MFCVYKYLKICSKISFSMSGISIGLSLLSKGPYSIAKNTLLRLASIKLCACTNSFDLPNRKLISQPIFCCNMNLLLSDKLRSDCQSP